MEQQRMEQQRVEEERRLAVSLEEEKRREYEVWFKNQEKAAMEYSASVQYQQSAQESAASSSTTTITSEKKMMESMSSSSSYQQHQQSLLSSSSANSSQAINTSSQQLTATPNMTGNSSSHTSGSSPAVVTPQGSSLTALSVTDGMEMSQMSQMSSSTVKQQSFSSSQTTEVFEGTQFEGGVLKGYKKKDEEMNGAAFEQQAAGSSHEKFMKDTGIFGGITGDHNSLVEDDVQFDYKKHTVRDLVGHFSKVKPKAEIPVQYLPEQKLYNGEQGPSLNYLSTKSESSCSTQSTMVKTTSLAKQDLDASKKEYEMRKQQGTSQIDSGAASSVTSAGHTQQQMASSTSEMSLEQQQQLSQRRQSLKEYLLIEPSSLSSANAGLLDPSAILRGENSSKWNQSEIHTAQTSLKS